MSAQSAAQLMDEVDDIVDRIVADRDRLLAENQRLREALQRILLASDRRMADGGDKFAYQDTNRQAGDIARAALGATK